MANNEFLKLKNGISTWEDILVHTLYYNSVYADGRAAHCEHAFEETKYSGTSPYGHLTSKATSPLRSCSLSPILYCTVQRVGR